MTKKDYQLLLPVLPKQPGNYKYKDVKFKISYFGQVKNLKNRISSNYTNDKNMANKRWREVKI